MNVAAEPKTRFRHQGTSEYARIYNRGLEDEDKVIAFLEATKQHCLVVCDRKEEQFLDIDVILDGVPTSIKTMHQGERYGNIYMELVTQRRQSARVDQDSTDYVNALAARIGKQMGWLHLDNPESWFKGWWFTGEAQQYLIWQGTTLTLYSKEAIAAHIEARGFCKILPLSGSVLASQGGKNTVCGYLNVAEVPYLRRWTFRDGTRVRYNPL